MNQTSRAFLYAFWLLFLFPIPSCHTPEEAVAWSDELANAAIARKSEEIFGEARPFSVKGPAQRIMAEVIDPETGIVKPGSALDLDLASILQVAAANSREFQTEKEALYRTTLNWIVQRERFRPTIFATTDGAVTSARGTESFSTSGDLGVTQFLEIGGQYTLSMGLDFLRFLSAPTTENAASLLSLDITLPFLRNAGRQIATENLRQADRNVLYALRDFERFKQTYSVSIVSSYLRVLGQAQRVKNEEATVKSLELSRLEAEAKYEEGRFPLVEVDQNRQAELRGRDRVVRARQGLERSLDNLKDLMGLPVDMELHVELSDLAKLDEFVDNDAALDAEPIAGDRAIVLSLRARFDFRTVVDTVADSLRRLFIAENALEPDLTLLLSVRPESDNLFPFAFDVNDGTYSARASADFGIDRDVEKAEYRRALIDVDAALRAQEDFRERLKIEVREALRSLRQSRESYLIAAASVSLAEVRLDAAQDLLREGRARTRDFLEAQDALLASQNDLIDTRVEYRIAFLELLRDTGVLAVAAEGLDYEATRALLSDT